jgi:II/X family phage/plasmid replication protein
VIDWLKFRVPFTPTEKIGGDRVMVINPDGVIQWEKLRPLEVVGSHDSSLRASCCPITNRLMIDGNPVKFFQGHNVFGCDDVKGLAAAAFRVVERLLKLPVDEHFAKMVELGEFDLLRVDVTEMYSVGSRARARSMIRSLGERAVMRRRGRGEFKDGTLYYGMHSRRWAGKVYCKGDEIEAKGHRIGESVFDAPTVRAFADDKVRIEFVIRAMELDRRGLDRGFAWCDTTPRDLYRELLATLELPDMIELPGETLDGLAPRLQLVYQAWKRGDDLRAVVPRRSFYRYRRELLNLGVDISIPQPKDRSSNVVPLVSIIEARPVGVPSWAIGTRAYFDPSEFRKAG